MIEASYINPNPTSASTSEEPKPLAATALGGYAPAVSAPSNYAPSPSEIAAKTTQPPVTQLAIDESKKDEVESRRARLSSNLIEQRHSLIEILGTVILSVIVGLYLIFGLTVMSLFLKGSAFNDLKVTTLILIGMTGSIPTILSITLIVGLFAKEKDQSKEDKSMLDASLAAKTCIEFVKLLKAPH